MLLKSILYNVTFPTPLKWEDMVASEKKAGVYGDYDSYKKSEYTVKSFDGYKLNCTMVSEDSSDRYVIISHGYTCNRIGSVKYLNMYKRLGFNCIISDNRGCGKNDPAPITMGFYEARDLAAIIKDTRRRFGENIYLGLHGESMGAAMSLMQLGNDDNISFVVSDCSFADYDKLAKSVAKFKYHIPGFLIGRLSKYCKRTYGFGFDELRPYLSIEKTKTPICFIHGKEDRFIPPEHCKNLYESAAGYKEIHLFDNARHAQSYYTDRAAYEKIVADFISKIENNNNDKVSSYKV